MALFHPLEEKFVVAGSREECGQEMRGGAAGRPAFPGRRVLRGALPRVGTVPSAAGLGDIHVTLTPEGSGSTCITARAMAFPNLFALVFSPERRILDQFAGGLH